MCVSAPLPTEREDVCFRPSSNGEGSCVFLCLSQREREDSHSMPVLGYMGIEPLGDAVLRTAGTDALGSTGGRRRIVAVTPALTDDPATVRIWGTGTSGISGFVPGGAAFSSTAGAASAGGLV